MLQLKGIVSSQERDERERRMQLTLAAVLTNGDCNILAQIFKGHELIYDKTDVDLMHHKFYLSRYDKILFPGDKEYVDLFGNHGVYNSPLCVFIGKKNPFDSDIPIFNPDYKFSGIFGNRKGDDLKEKVISKCSLNNIEYVYYNTDDYSLEFKDMIISVIPFPDEQRPAEIGSLAPLFGAICSRILFLNIPSKTRDAEEALHYYTMSVEHNQHKVLRIGVVPSSPNPKMANNEFIKRGWYTHMLTDITDITKFAIRIPEKPQKSGKELGMPMSKYGGDNNGCEES